MLNTYLIFSNAIEKCTRISSYLCMHAYVYANEQDNIRYILIRVLYPLYSALSEILSLENMWHCWTWMQHNGTWMPSQKIIDMKKHEYRSKSTLIICRFSALSPEEQKLRLFLDYRNIILVTECWVLFTNFQLKCDIFIFSKDTYSFNYLKYFLSTQYQCNSVIG